MRRARLARALLAAAAVLAAWPGAAPGQELDCLIEPRVTVELATPVEGVIDRVLVDRGDYVNKGDVVIELESSVERATVEMARARAAQTAPLRSAKAALVYAEQTLARREELHRTHVSSRQELDEARSQHELALERVHEAEEQQRLAQLELQRARQALGLRQIKSPISGVVIKREFDPGEYADTRAILEIAEVDPLRVEVFAPVGLLGRIRPGDVARVLPEAPVGGSHEATVVVVDPVVDAASGTFGVRLELPNPDHALPAGLNCRVRFGPETGPLATAPGEAPRAEPPPVEAAPAGAEPPEGGAAEPAPEPAPEPRGPRAGAEPDGALGMCEEGGMCEESGALSLASADVTPAGAEPDAARAPVAGPEPVAAPEPPAAAGPEPVAEAEPPAVAEPPAAVSAAAQTAAVRRAQFTSEVVDREPVDSVERLANTHRGLFFFTELRGLQGHTVTHRWMHGGVVRAEKSFAVGGPRWRVYSQIDLAPGWLGEWSVTVLDESGRVLDRARFEYVSADPAAPAGPDSDANEPSAE